MKKGRESKLLKFPEIQGIVNDQIRRYIYENRRTFTWIADVTGLSKSRFTELQKDDGVGGFLHKLSESVLEPLIGRDIVPLDIVADKIDTKDLKKAEWLKNQKRLQIIKRLASKGFPIDDKLEEWENEAK